MPAEHELSYRYRGWRVVAGCFLMAMFGWGLGFYGHSVYLAELTRLHGWPAGAISTASTLYYLVSALLVVFVSDAIRRFGPRPVVLTGIASLVISATAIGCATSKAHIFAAYLVMSVGWATLTLAAITNILDLWFQEKRGLAISIALNGASTGGIVGAPLLIWLSGLYGFRTAMVIAAAATIVVLLPVALVWMERPRGAAAGADAPAETAASLLKRRDLLVSPHFWTVAAPFCLGLLAQVGFIVHQIALLEPSLGRHGAGFAVAITTIMAVVGRVGMGFVIDRLDQRQLTAISLLTQAVALLVMTFTASPWLLYICCAIFGFSVGNLITLPALIIQREYDAASFGMLTALVVAIVQIAYSFGPGLLGILRDLSGSYTLPLYVCMVLEIAGAIVVMLPAMQIKALREGRP
jgi:predicted MFS family arabinose efflux permease